MNNLLPSVLLFFIISVIFATVLMTRAMISALVMVLMMLIGCIVLTQAPTLSNSALTMARVFHHYVVDDNDDEDNSSNTTIGVQYTIWRCCRLNATIRIPLFPLP